jgi:hypothetical protein
MTNINHFLKRLPKMLKLAASKPGHGKHRLYAEIWRDDDEKPKRVSFGWNNPKEDELSALYKRHELAEGTCAEAEAVIRALSKHNRIAGSTVYVARAKKEKRGGPLIPGHSQPCVGCMRLLEDFDVRCVGYVNENGDAVMEAICPR